jgi:Alpha/beta hydrolase domain
MNRCITLVAVGLACLLACSLAVAVSPAGAEVPAPIVTGPIPANAPLGDPSHDYPQVATALDLASIGYVEEEYFFSGTANVYNTPPLTTATVVSSGHRYKSRLIVQRAILSVEAGAPHCWPPCRRYS